MAIFNYNDIFEALKPARRSWKPKHVSECDGGGGDAGGAAASGDAGGIAADVGISNGEVLGTCDHSEHGYFGPGCFHVPSKCAFPLHRWEIGNGGSKRKKTKKGKDKKTPYEKNMKVVIDMLNEADINVNPGKVSAPKKLIKGRLLRIAKAIKSINDVKKVEREFENKGVDRVKDMPSKFAKAKQTFLEFGEFLKDVCQGKYKTDWFTLSLLTIAVVYVLSPVDLIPDAIVGLGWIDDVTVIMWIYQTVKAEFMKWKESKSSIDIGAELDNAIAARDNSKKSVSAAASLTERKMSRSELDGFYDSLRDGEVEFVFIKKDGSRREARGTLNATLMPRRAEIERIYQEQGVDLAELEARLEARKDYMPYFWDLDNNGYRQFHVSRFEGITSEVPILESDATKNIKIWIDDVRPAPDASWTIINSVDQFIDLINNIGIDSVEIISIDHDAGEFYNDGGDYIRCLDFLEFIEADNVRIKIHSANPVGVKNMRAIIQKNGWTEVR